MIDVEFDVTSDVPGYWDGYWERNGGLGGGNLDPDTVSKTLKEYHRELWGRELPNGERLCLEKSGGYLAWKGTKFGSDSIIVSFRYKSWPLIREITGTLPDYKKYYEDYVHRSCTIAGSIIFPKHQGSINQCKGTNKKIRDRWDLTLECIRRFYADEKSPLSQVLETDRGFFELFNDFKGYTEFFFLQDCVSKDFSRVNLWLKNNNFEEDALPKSVEEYFCFMEKEELFLSQRKQRMARFIKENRL